jgi:hypothetical protein
MVSPAECLGMLTAVPGQWAFLGTEISRTECVDGSVDAQDITGAES